MQSTIERKQQGAHRKRILSTRQRYQDNVYGTQLFLRPAWRVQRRPAGLVFVLVIVAVDEMKTPSHTVDVLSFTPPPGWRTTHEGGSGALTMVDPHGEKDSSCQITVHNGLQSRGDLVADFFSEWTAIVGSALPDVDDVLYEGARIVGVAHKYVQLITYSAGAKMASVLVVNPSLGSYEAHRPTIDSFLASVIVNSAPSDTPRVDVDREEQEEQEKLSEPGSTDANATPRADSAQEFVLQSPQRAAVVPKDIYSQVRDTIPIFPPAESTHSSADALVPIHGGQPDRMSDLTGEWVVPAASVGNHDVLAPGAMPLSQATIQKFIGTLSWILDLAIPTEFCDRIRAEIAAGCATADTQMISETQQLVGAFEHLSTLDLETRDALREQHQAEVVAGLRSCPDPWATALLQLYDRANAPIAMGNPPLTQEIANCYFDLIGLLQAIQSGHEWQPLPEQVKIAHAQVLATQYPWLHSSQQAWFASLPKGWTALRATWKNVPAEGRERMRQQILGTLGSTVGQIRMQMQEPSTRSRQPPADATLEPIRQTGMRAPSPTPPQPADDMDRAIAAFGRDQSQTDALVAKITATDKAQDEQLEKENTEQLEMRLQREARYAQVLSNTMSSRHQTMMSIIRNF